MGNCDHCEDHSGVETSLGYLKDTQKEIKSGIDKLQTRVLVLLASLSLSCLLLLLNFIIKYYAPATAIAKEIINK